MDRFQWEDKYKMEEKIMKLTSAGIKGSNSNRIQSSNSFANYINYKIENEKYSLNLGLRNENLIGKRIDFGKSDTERLGLDLNRRENIINAVIPGGGFMYNINNSSNTFYGYTNSKVFLLQFGDKPETELIKSLDKLYGLSESY